MLRDCVAGGIVPWSQPDWKPTLHIAALASCRSLGYKARLFRPLLGHLNLDEVNHGARMCNNREAPPGWQQCVAREQQDASSLFAESAVAPFLGGR
jgi:hypothetical protein